MAENPFESFLTGMIGGATAGARRRTMVEQGKQAAGAAEDFFGGGPIDPPKAPGMGATFLAGLQLARTLPTTPGQKLQADQVKLQIANQVLDEQIFEAKQQAAEAEKIALKTKASKEARAERDNSILFADLLSRATTDLSAGKFDTLSGIKKEAEGLPVTQQVQLNSAIGDLSRTYDLQKVREFSSNQEILSQYMAPEDVQKLGPMQAQTLVEILSGRYQSGIGQMVGDLNNLNTLGLTNLSALVMPAIEKQAKSVGRVVEFSPTTGTYIMRQELIGGTGKDLSVAEQAALNKSEKVYKEVRPFIDQALRLVTENPDSFGSSGELTGLTNRMKSLLGVIPFVEFKQDMTRREVETSINTLIGKTLPALAGTSLGRMTENDAKLLKAPLPKLDVFNPAEVVKQQLETLDFRVSLAYILDQQKRGTIAQVIDNEGPVEFAKIMSRANKEGFGSQERTVLRAIDEAVTHISSNPNMQDADSDIKALFMELGASGQFNDAELQLILDNVPQG